MRITTSMVQRNVLSDLNSLSEKLAKTQSKASSGKEITRPSDNPYQAARALGLRQNLAANEQYQSNISDARGWQDATESALGSITDFVNRAQSLLLEGATDSSDVGARNSVADEIDQIIQGLKETSNASFGDRFLMSGTATSTAPYKLGDDDAYQGDEAGLDPTVAGVVREIGPGVTISINSVAREILGDGRANPTDGKLLNTLRDISEHLRANDGAALRGGDITNLKASLDDVLKVRARNGAMSNRLDAASSRLEQIQGAVTEQLSDTEDADIAKTIIDFNSQSAAYQASLRAGANIVQASLMDFLR
jgi:flagellar hook-associated protein 3 FlgL